MMTKMMKFELKKLLKSNRGALVIALFFLSELAVLILSDSPVNPGAALYRGQYLAELRAVEGPWTPEKAELLEARARDANGAGEGFDVLYKQYLYVNEGRENRFFLDANGWAGLLAERLPDLPLAAAIILLCVPVYCAEASSGMEPLALTSREGRRLYGSKKLLLALTLAAGLSVSSDLIRLAFYALKYGLPHPDYPMQSVESLGTAEKSLPLWGAEALAAGLRLLGSAELALLTLLFSALCGQFALSAFLSTALVLLPLIGLDRSLQYSLPLPSSLMSAMGYIKGSEFAADAVTGESVAVFREVGPPELALTGAGAVFICAVCVLLIRKRYKTALTGGGKHKFKPAAPFLALAVCLALSGCGKDASFERALYNGPGARTHEYNGLTVSVIDGELTVTDADGNSSPLVRDPLKSVNGAVYSESFYGEGKYVYLWKTDSDGYGEKLSSDTGKTYIISLIRVDLDTFTYNVVFESVLQHTVLGIDVPINEPFDLTGAF